MTDLALSFAMRAHALHMEQRDDEAMRLLDAALKIEPALTGALFLKGIIALSHGDYRTGWPLYELRDQQHDATKYDMGRFKDRPWDGRPFSGRLLIWAEQGLGDAVQMLRFLPLVRQCCPDVQLEVRQELFRLAKFNKLAPRIVPRGKAEPYDRQCSLMSLPYVLGIEQIAPVRGYLRAAHADMEVPKIGLCWRGSLLTHHARQKSMSFDQFAAMTEGLDCLSLQLEDLPVRDMHGTASIIDKMDLVIAIDTATAHLAAALGKEVWLLLSVDCDWRWLQKRSDSPWYPTMRLFRQQKPGDWRPVIEQVTDCLRQRFAATAA